MQTILQILIAVLFSHFSVAECAEETKNEVTQQDPSSRTIWIQHHHPEAIENYYMV